MKQVNVRLTDEDFTLLEEVMARLSKMWDMKVSQADAIRIGLLALGDNLDTHSEPRPLRPEGEAAPTPVTKTRGRKKKEEG